MNEEEIAIRCPSCGSILVEEYDNPGLWECRYCQSVFPVDFGRRVNTLHSGLDHQPYRQK